MDVQYAAESNIAMLESRDWLADSFPIFFPNVGPEVTATFFGCDLEFTRDSTWSVPVIHDPQQWNAVATMPGDFTNPYWRTIEALTDYALERCDDRYIVGVTDLHGNYDILAALRDPEALCMDLIDCPDLVRKAGRRCAEVFVEAYERSYRRLAAAGHGSTTWLPTYHEGPSYVPSCDFWCMVSPQIGREWIWPDIQLEMEPLDRAIFHLDGAQALRHLDLLLESPKINAIQWVYGDGGGPATRWMDVYKRIVASGKGVRVEGLGPRDALAVLEEVGPKGVYLVVYGDFDCIASAEAFLADVERLSVR
jgi:hypothetical protein